MTHSDDNGLVLPPAIAPTHLRILVLADDKDEAEPLYSYLSDFVSSRAGRISIVDEPLRFEIQVVGRRPGSAFWEAVKQGVPLIAQIGPKEKEQGTITFTIRSDEKLTRQTMPIEQFVDSIPVLLHEMQESLLSRATQFRNMNTVSPLSIQELRHHFDHRQISPFAICPIDIAIENSEAFQAELAERKLSIRCLLSSTNSDPQLKDSAKCLFSGNTATHRALIAKSY